MANFGEEQKVLPKSSKGFFYSTTLLIFVIVLTIGIKIYVSSIESSIKEMREQISELQVTYNTLRQNREIQAYDLLVANQSKLEEKSYMSNVPLFVAELDKVEYKYGVNLTGFAYSNGSISTSIMAETGEIEENKDIDSAVAFADIDNSNIPEEAYKKLVSMIGDFRDREDNNMVIVEDNMETTNEEKIEDTTGEIFDLEFIGNYSGNEVISTNIELNVK